MYYLSLDSLNTNQFEVESPPSYYAVYTRRPKVYTYAPSSKDIPREEDVIEEEPCDEVAGNINEVRSVSSVLLSLYNLHLSINCEVLDIYNTVVKFIILFLSNAVRLSQYQ